MTNMHRLRTHGRIRHRNKHLIFREVLVAGDDELAVRELVRVWMNPGTAEQVMGMLKLGLDGLRANLEAQAKAMGYTKTKTEAK